MASKQHQNGKKSRLPKKWKNYLAVIIIIVGAFLFAFSDTIFGPATQHLTQAELIQKARAGQVAEVVYKDDTHLTVKLKDNTTPWEVTYPEAIATETFKSLLEANVAVKPEESEGFPWGALVTFLITTAWGLLLLSLSRHFLKELGAKLKGEVHGTHPSTRFDDVKGIPEVVDELRTYVDILKYPKRYRELGARIPSGVVLYGPPGTGKTLLAEAVAGEAKVPFYKVTGSEVRSKWIGEAGKAIRKYFEKARKHPVSIIFFDEGDTIGGRRGEGYSGGDQEHRAMVNELLAQMNHNIPGGRVFVIIATNDPELLDEALTRPGRIDVKLAVLPPDVHGRRDILEVHTKGKPLGLDVNLDETAKETYGYTGAGIEALINNAAIHAGKRGAKTIDRADIDHAQTVMNAGPARKGIVVSDKDKRVTASHEAGHALCSQVLDLMPNPTSITILAHGYSGGHTRIIPDEATQSLYTTRVAAKQQLIMFMGGVAGEKLALDADFTNGAASDREKATQLATEMVCEWGMGTYNANFDHDWRNGPHADAVWDQVEALLDEAELAAINLLLQHKPAFDALVEALLEKETLRAAELQAFRPTPVSTDEFKAYQEKYARALESVQIRASDRKVSHLSGHSLV